MWRLLVLIAALAAAAGFALRTGDPLPPADYVMAQKDDFFTLDPQRMSYNQDIRLCYSIFEGLTRWDNDTFEILPAAAERWEISDDGRTYTFHVREEAQWSNGDSVTAQDFVRSWRRAMLPDAAADYTQMFFLIEGAEEFFHWRGRQVQEYGLRPAAERTAAAAERLRAEAMEEFERSVGLRAIDDHTLEVRLTRPTPYFLDLCCFAPFHPAHPPSVERCTTVNAATGAIQEQRDWTRPPHIVSNGPMIVRSWRFKRDMRLERNPYYWNQDMIRSDSVSIVFMTNPNTALLAYETGAVDWVEEVVVDYLPDLIDDAKRGKRDDVIGVPNFGTYFWSFNCKRALPDGRANPFHDPRVRRAFAMAVNKRDVVDRVRRVDEPLAETLIPRDSIPGYDPSHAIRTLPHEPAAARKLLDEAGWRDTDGDGKRENAAGEPFPIVELLCSTASYHEDIAQALQAMWEKELGVRSRIAPKESKIFKDDLKNHNYMVARGNWFGDYGDPTTFLEINRTGDGNNDRAFSDPHYDGLLDRAQVETDPAQRMRILEEAERYLVQEALPLIPLFQQVRYYMFDPDRMRHISRHPRVTQYFWEIEKAPAGPAPAEAAY